MASTTGSGKSLLQKDYDAPYKRALSNWQRLSYGVGHVMNDLTAAMWFSYLLLYLTEVENFENVFAGNLILLGQVADAICTPLVGMESDRTRTGFCNLGKRKSWHLIGTICTIVTFPFIFEPCITCSKSSSALQMIYYAPFVVIFQFGWASVQISHLSYSSEITPNKHERVILQSIRNFFTVFANIAVFGIFSLLFILGPDCHHSISSGVDLDSSDIPKFRYLTFICIGIGIVFNIIFYVGTSKISRKKQGARESPKTDNDTDKNLEEGQEKRYHSLSTTSLDRSIIKQSDMTWVDWLREHQFYQVGLLYMFTRLFFNISQVYFGIYLTKTLRMKKMYVAILPLVLYGSSFLASTLAPTLNKAVGRKLAYVVGVVFGVSANLWLFFMEEDSDQIYGASIFLGITDSLILITSLSMVSDLIAANVESGAFVFGAMSFTDKLSNGVAILIIQKLDPCSTDDCPTAADYYRHIESLVPGGAIVCAFLVLLTLMPQVLGDRRKKNKYVQMKEHKKYSSKANRPIYSVSQDETLQVQGRNVQCDDVYNYEVEVYPPSDTERLIHI